MSNPNDRSEPQPIRLLLELNALAEAVAGLVHNLVSLTGPIRLEQALQSGTGPYASLPKHIEEAHSRFQDLYQSTNMSLDEVPSEQYVVEAEENQAYPTATGVGSKFV